MNNTIILFTVVIFTVLITVNLQPADAFLSQSTAGWVYELNPGESQVLTWTITNTEDALINIEFRAEGQGSELFVFEKVATLEFNESRSFEFIVIIPDDHPDNIEYHPILFALEKATRDSEVGAASVLINYQMSARPIIKIGDNPIFTPEPKPVKVEEELVEVEQPKEDDLIVIPTETLEEKLARIQAVNEANKVEEQLAPDKSMETQSSILGDSYEDEPISQVTSKESTSDGGGCLIATAAYGTELAPQIQLLREIRDNQLLNTESGTIFMSSFNQFYYSFSPVIADLERENPLFQQTVRAFITPMVTTLSIMTLADGNSEAEVLGLGISVIALNLGMYIGMPVFGILKLCQLTKKI